MFKCRTLCIKQPFIHEPRLADVLILFIAVTHAGLSDGIQAALINLSFLHFVIGKETKIASLNASWSPCP